MQTKVPLGILVVIWSAGCILEHIPSGSY